MWAIGIIATLAVGLISIIATRRFSGTRKHLAFYRDRYRLIEHKVGSSLQLYYEGEEIQDASVVIVTLKYRGNEPIRPDDYEQPISFEFDSEARIFSLEIADKNPENLNALVNLEADARARLEPALFNDRDRVTVKMLVSKCYSLPAISGRIAGVHEIQDALEPTRFEKFSEALIGRVIDRALPLASTLFFLTIGSFVLAFRFDVTWGAPLAGALLALAMMTSMFGIINKTF